MHLCKWTNTGLEVFLNFLFFYFFLFLKANISIQRQTGSPDFYLKSPSTQPSWRAAVTPRKWKEKKEKKNWGRGEDVKGSAVGTRRWKVIAVRLTPRLGGLGGLGEREKAARKVRKVTQRLSKFFPSFSLCIPNLYAKCSCVTPGFLISLQYPLKSA